MTKCNKTPKTLIKCNIVDHLHEKVGFSKKELTTFVDDVFRLLAYGLVKKQKVVISNFGTFSVRYKKARKVFNPKTSTLTSVDSRYSINFVPSKNFRSYINGNVDNDSE